MWKDSYPPVYNLPLNTRRPQWGFPWSLLFSEQIQFPQSFTIGEVLQPFDLPHGSSRPTLKSQYLSYFGDPRLGCSTPAETSQGRVEWDDHLPRPAGHISFEEAKDIVELVGCKHTLPVHVQHFVHQDSEGPFGWYPFFLLDQLFHYANLHRLHSVQLSRLLTKKLKSTGLKTEAWGTSVVTDLYLDIPL